MKVENFEDLNIYKEAKELNKRIYDVTKEVKFARDFGLVDQIRRASVSVMSNIAEGFERGSNTEFVKFLFIAKGSSGEVRSQISVALEQKYIDDKVHNDIFDRCRRINGMISNLITYLNNSKLDKKKNRAKE